RGVIPQAGLLFETALHRATRRTASGGRRVRSGDPELDRELISEGHPWLILAALDAKTRARLTACAIDAVSIELRAGVLSAELVPSEEERLARQLTALFSLALLLVPAGAPRERLLANAHHEMLAEPRRLQLRALYELASLVPDPAQARRERAEVTELAVALL